MRCKMWLILIAMLAMASSAHAANKPQHVRATLLADVSQIVPGKPFHLGVKLDIDPGWHVYWLNPGDSGEATRITLDLPKGFAAGDVQFPTPIKIVDPGGINVYGYTNSVMFIATVTPDKSLPVGDADLSANVSYLVCNDVCIPGHATVDLKLPITAAGAKALPDNAKLFGDWTAQLPLTPKDFSDASFSQAIDPEKDSVTFSFWVWADSTNPDIFPGPSDDINVAVKQGGRFTDAARTAEEFTLTITPLAGHAMPKVKLPVVIGWTEKWGNHRGLVTEIDLSKLISADSKPPHG
jgi:DsbC/DsbD-like thiol-disulfide interchange protein